MRVLKATFTVTSWKNTLGKKRAGTYYIDDFFVVYVHVQEFRNNIIILFGPNRQDWYLNYDIYTRLVIGRQKENLFFYFASSFDKNQEMFIMNIQHVDYIVSVDFYCYIYNLLRYLETFLYQMSYITVISDHTL